MPVPVASKAMVLDHPQLPLPTETACGSDRSLLCCGLSAAKLD